MKKLISIVVLCLGMALPLLAVDVDEDNQYVIIETDGYMVHWKKAAQMGYMQAFLPGSQDSLIGVGSRAFYHSSNYAGAWNDWQELSDWEIIEQGGGKAIVQYKSRDAGSKEYTCKAAGFGLPLKGAETL